MTSFSVQSFGCRVNQAEAFAWVSEFQRRGFLFQTDHSRSDIILVNTCTVTQRADSDVRMFIRKMHRTNPKARLVLTGCYAERAAEELESMPQVWKIVPNQKKEDLCQRLFPDSVPESGSFVRPYRSRALVKIQDGCDYGCRFCVVPSVRGPSKSSTREGVVRQVRDAAAQGFREVVLTGVHLCLYGRDLKPKQTLLGLLEELEGITDLKQIRVSSLDPRLLSDDLLDHLTSSPMICPHFHLSLQSGSDRLLRSMGREIGTKTYLRILDRFGEKVPMAALGADIMVGFPGESEVDFQRTRDFLASSPLTYFHVFAYSPRPGTPAADWTQVMNRVKFERASELRNLSQQKNMRFRQIFLGKECEGIVIRKEQTRTHILTSNYIDVTVPFAPADERETVTVRITEVSQDKTSGEVIEQGGDPCRFPA
jgi:threonylcarbamoyladenosine tRNA methylthiotransferase MtaB